MRKRKGFIFKNMMKGAKYPLVEVESPEALQGRFPLQRDGEGEFRSQDRIDRPS